MLTLRVAPSDNQFSFGVSVMESSDQITNIFKLNQSIFICFEQSAIDEVIHRLTTYVELFCGIGFIELHGDEYTLPHISSASLYRPFFSTILEGIIHFQRLQIRPYSTIKT